MRLESLTALTSKLGPEGATHELARCATFGIRVLAPCEYPPGLAHLNDVPEVLYVRGNPEWPRGVVAVVGSRRATALGQRQAFELGRGLAAAGVAVVSGLARGIDSAALEGALAGGGRPLAVLGNGFPGIYPPENTSLANRIVDAQGALLTEYSLETPPRRHHFPHRNRMISALAAAVVVVEATRRSGSLITVSWGLEQGREIFAFPGPSDGPHYAGCHDLIRQGATLVTGADEVLEHLAGSRLHPAGWPAETWQCVVARAVAEGASTPEEVAVRTGLPPALVLRGWMGSAFSPRPEAGSDPNVVD